MKMVFYPNHFETSDSVSYVDIMERHCSSCGLPFLTLENQEMCQDCTDFLNPTIREYRKLRIVDVFENSNVSVADLTNYSWSTKLPHFMIKCDDVIIVIQVDEQQNQSRPCECDVAYMIVVHQNFHPSPVTFIRYNPDNYNDVSGLKHDGERQNPERENRLVNLIQNIKNGNIKPSGLSVYYLYYDGDDGTDKPIDIHYSNDSLIKIVDSIESTRVYEMT